MAFKGDQLRRVGYVRRLFSYQWRSGEEPNASLDLAFGQIAVFVTVIVLLVGANQFLDDMVHFQ